MFIITQGLPFSKLGAIRADGESVDATGWAVTATLRSPCDGTFTESLSVTWIDQSIGSFQMENTASTSTYPLGRLILEVFLQPPSGPQIKADPEPVQVEKF